jgi:hypothetical protein
MVKCVRIYDLNRAPAHRKLTHEREHPIPRARASDGDPLYPPLCEEDPHEASTPKPEDEEGSIRQTVTEKNSRCRMPISKAELARGVL